MAANFVDVEVIGDLGTDCRHGMLGQKHHWSGRLEGGDSEYSQISGIRRAGEQRLALASWRLKGLSADVFQGV